MEQQVAAKRQEVEAFRSSNDIVSTERDENQLLSAAKGLATGLNEAKGKLAAAEGQLRAVRNAAADRLARLEASDSETAPHLEILEAASVPQLPWRPLYARDAGISLGAAMALGFLAV